MTLKKAEFWLWASQCDLFSKSVPVFYVNVVLCDRLVHVLNQGTKMSTVIIDYNSKKVFGKALMCDFSKMSEKIRKADVVVEMDMKGIDIK